MAMEEEMIGVKLCPSDQELVGWFLAKKARNEEIPKCYPILDDGRQIFGDEQLPWDLFKDNDPYWQFLSNFDSKKQQKKIIYAFTKLVPVGSNAAAADNKNHQHRRHVKRTAGCGVWSGKSKNQKIKLRNGQTLGNRTSFTFKIEGIANKGRWILHEFSMDQTDWVLCRISVDLPAPILDAPSPTSNDEVVVNIPDDDVDQFTRKRKSTSDDGVGITSKRACLVGQETDRQQILVQPPDSAANQPVPSNSMDSIVTDVFPNEALDEPHQFDIDWARLLATAVSMPSNSMDSIITNDIPDEEFYEPQQGNDEHWTRLLAIADQSPGSFDLLEYLPSDQNQGSSISAQNMQHLPSYDGLVNIGATNDCSEKTSSDDQTPTYPSSDDNNTEGDPEDWGELDDLLEQV